MVKDAVGLVQWAAWQVAAILRDRFTSGHYPRDRDLRTAAEFSVGATVIYHAYQVLGRWGRITRRPGRGWRVRAQPDRQTLALPHGGTLHARMPSPEERKRLTIPDGVPVMVVADEIYPADQYAVIVGDHGFVPGDRLTKEPLVDSQGRTPGP